MNLPHSKDFVFLLSDKLDRKLQLERRVKLESHYNEVFKIGKAVYLIKWETIYCILIAQVCLYNTLLLLLFFFLSSLLFHGNMQL